jgi:hypothetical protein
MMFRARIALVSMALVAACGGEVGNQGEPNPRSGPPCPTSIDEVVSQVFELSCVDAGCHGSNDRAAGLDLQASSLELELFGKEAALCDAEVRVVPGDAASSYLMDKLRGTGCGAQMPIGAPLPNETIDCIAAWIDGLDPAGACETCGAGLLCIDLATDPANCGSCGNVCPAAASCTNGSCTCPGSESICNESCVDLMSDRMNCGSCGTDCGDLFCLEGQCSSDCGGLTECSGACVDLSSDPKHCGVCGNPCGTGSSCIDSECQCGDTAVSLANDVQPVFTANCASSGCHDGNNRPGGGPGASAGATSLDLRAGNTLQSLLDTTTPCGPVLVPGDVGASVLVGKIDGSELCMGSLMPKGNGSLTTQEIDLIATWVCQGAEDN